MRIRPSARLFAQRILDPLLEGVRRLSRYCAWAGGAIFFAAFFRAASLGFLYLFFARLRGLQVINDEQEKFTDMVAQSQRRHLGADRC